MQEMNFNPECQKKKIFSTSFHYEKASHDIDHISLFTFASRTIGTKFAAQL